MLLPRIPEVQNIGRISSLSAGNGIDWLLAIVISRTPSARNRKLTGVKAKP